MFALIHALLRFLGFGGIAAVKPSPTRTVPVSPVFQKMLALAKPRTETPQPEKLTWGEAAGILARKAGQRPASEAPPSERRVKLAREVLPLVVRQYLYMLEILGRAFPKVGADGEAAFERRLRQLALTDVATWLAGLWSGKPVTIPEHITEVLIQRAANAMGQVQPEVMQEGQEPHFVADAETQMCVVDLATKFCVFPRVIGRGDTDLIELPGTDKRFHRESVARSNWAFWLGYAGQVFEPPVIPEGVRDADDAVAELIPHVAPDQVKP
jgi:hypothetical protein